MPWGSLLCFLVPRLLIYSASYVALVTMAITFHLHAMLRAIPFAVDVQVAVKWNMKKLSVLLVSMRNVNPVSNAHSLTRALRDSALGATSMNRGGGLIAVKARLGSLCRATLST